MAFGETLALLVLGMAIGAAAAVALGARRLAARSPPNQGRLTAAWSLAELGSPTILARDLADAAVALPAGSRAVVSGRAGPEALRGCEVRRAAEGAVPVEAAVSADGSRALLFPGGLRAGALALVVSDAALAARVASLAASAWASAVPYVERRALGDLVGEPGLPVEAEGRVAQALPRPGGAAGVLLRLEDGGHSAAVHAERGDGLVGRRVRVQGRLARDAGGYPVVEAERVVALE